MLQRKVLGSLLDEFDVISVREKTSVSPCLTSVLTSPMQILPGMVIFILCFCVSVFKKKPLLTVGVWVREVPDGDVGTFEGGDRFQETLHVHFL